MLKIKRNGTTIVEQRQGSGTLTWAVSATDFFTGTGTRTYTVTIANLGSNPKGSATTTFVTLRSLAVIEVKK
jgi:hypothetical protein